MFGTNCLGTHHSIVYGEYSTEYEKKNSRKHNIWWECPNNYGTLDKHGEWMEHWEPPLKMFGDKHKRFPQI